jgi:hypothetical protein
MWLAGVLLAGDPVSVYLSFDGRPSLDALEAMKSEAAGLVERAGLTLDWRWLATNTGREGAHRLVVVHFTGSCASGVRLAPLKAPSSVVTLASTAMESGRVLPYSEVRCDAVRRFLPQIESAVSRRERDLVLGVALGRVLAHELYHAVLRNSHHSYSGLAKAIQTPEELMSQSLYDRSLTVAAR